MKYRLLFFFLSILVFSATFAHAEKFKVGQIYTLTGTFATFGQAAINATELAKKDHPELFTNIEFIFEDSRYEGPKTISAYKKLRTQDQVDLIYVWGDAPSEVLAPIAEKDRQVILLSTTDSQPVKNKKFVLRSHFDSQQLMATAAQEIISKGYKDIAIVKTQMAFTENLVKNLEDSIGDKAKLTIIDDYNLPDLDFRSSILKIKQGNYDVIGVFVFTDQIVQLYKQMSQLKLNLPTFGTEAFEDQSIIKQTNGLMNGAFYAHLNVDQDFHKRYIAEFGNDFQIPFAAKAYDFAMLCGQLFNQAKKKPSPEQILEAFQNLKEIDGIVGKYNFVQTSDEMYFRFPVALKTIG